MSLEVIIGISIVVTIVLVVGVKLALQKVVSFKMDESTIVNFLKEFGETSANEGAIAAATSLTVERVSEVCNKSLLLVADSANEGMWYLKSE
ncbi:MAG: hypothetical protein CMI09_05395 [Oceanospirillaceae bacterium]|nr:hypothetical protein [Oceanospirillaceae bacterium]